MSRGKQESIIIAQAHEENRREIGDLKHTIADLNKNLAVNTEVIKGLKEFMEKEFVRHVGERKNVEGRVVKIEAKVDTIELKMAADTNAAERIKNLEAATAAYGAVSLPCVGYVPAEAFKPSVSLAGNLHDRRRAHPAVVFIPDSLGFPHRCRYQHRQ